jgi:hypothetical protein
MECPPGYAAYVAARTHGETLAHFDVLTQDQTLMTLAAEHAALTELIEAEPDSPHDTTRWARIGQIEHEAAAARWVQ